MSRPATILCTNIITDEFRRKAEDFGYTLLVVPFIDIRPSVDEELKRQIREVCSLEEPLVITSNNTMDILEECGICGKQCKSLFVVGRRTAERVTPVAWAHESEALAETMARTLEPQRVHVLGGNLMLGRLPRILQEKGFEVKTYTLYQTQILSHPVQESYDAVVFFSPSAVRGYFQGNREREGVAYFALGPTTKAELEKYTRQEIHMGAYPDKLLLLDAVADYFNKKKT